MKICKRQFRIVTDNYAGYEVQVRRWYFPFWQQIDFTSTHITVSSAEKFIEKTKYDWDFKKCEVKRYNCG